MPNPKDPKYKGKKSLFISDCVKIVSRENPDKTPKQVLGQCYGMWDNAKKESAASASLDNGDEILFFEERKKS